jgi:hypothetical protein
MGGVRIHESIVNHPALNGAPLSRSRAPPSSSEEGKNAESRLLGYRFGPILMRNSDVVLCVSAPCGAAAAHLFRGGDMEGNVVATRETSGPAALSS